MTSIKAVPSFSTLYLAPSKAGFSIFPEATTMNQSAYLESICGLKNHSCLVLLMVLLYSTAGALVNYKGLTVWDETGITQPFKPGFRQNVRSTDAIGN
jgi:hypothetical protein